MARRNSSGMSWGSSELPLPADAPKSEGVSLETIVRAMATMVTGCAENEDLTRVVHTILFRDHATGLVFTLHWNRIDGEEKVDED